VEGAKAEAEATRARERAAIFILTIDLLFKPVVSSKVREIVDHRSDGKYVASHILVYNSIMLSF